MWELRAEYKDGSFFECCVRARPWIDEDDEQQEYESWLIERKEGCVWFTVNYVYDE